MFLVLDCSGNDCKQSFQSVAVGSHDVKLEVCQEVDDDFKAIDACQNGAENVSSFGR